MTVTFVFVAPLIVAGLSLLAVGTTTRVAGPRSQQQRGPGQRLGHSLVFDEHRRGIVLPDGNWPQSDHARSDLWRWDGRRWERLAVTDSPATWMGAAASDSRRRRVVSHGGRDRRGAVGALWEWEGGERRRAADSTPGARFHHAMAYDAARGRVVMYGGAVGSRWDTSTWEWDGSVWTRLDVAGPGPRAAFRMVYDGKRRVVVLFGGLGPPDGDGRQRYLADTWEWNGVAWRKASDGGPPGRRDYSIAFDERRGVVLLYGGGAGSGPAPQRLDDMWQWDGETWREIPRRAPTPGHRYVSAMAYDRARDRTVLYGGYTCDRDTSQCGVADDTWEWDGARWMRVGER